MGAQGTGTSLHLPTCRVAQAPAVWQRSVTDAATDPASSPASLSSESALFAPVRSITVKNVLREVLLTGAEGETRVTCQVFTRIVTGFPYVRVLGKEGPKGVDTSASNWACDCFTRREGRSLNSQPASHKVPGHSHKGPGLTCPADWAGVPAGLLWAGTSLPPAPCLAFPRPAFPCYSMSKVLSCPRKVTSTGSSECDLMWK